MRGCHGPARAHSYLLGTGRPVHAYLRRRVVEFGSLVLSSGRTKLLDRHRSAVLLHPGVVANALEVPSDLDSWLAGANLEPAISDLTGDFGQRKRCAVKTDYREEIPAEIEAHFFRDAREVLRLALESASVRTPGERTKLPTQ